ncbi:putative shikimate O-hydroxycinnamoyltransferase [Medicago truncatula]|uniref:Transferase n=2 Tax=Medicago truncatula TaxID=3880 RepID=Q2HVN0_MEDTR|nr:shikimate O-hydroxycinnamoyltransferase [Medicago truncatula]ABD28417.1 Transferase [Medicago truncatula]RHN47483.1 putative shikimate O-hydroxycinnamoyltransferase [Medicago truncatula]
MVSVQSQSIVIPSKPTPNPKLFSLCEQIKLRTHAPLLYVFKPHNHKNTSTFLETLKKSLSQALVAYYPLAGRLSLIKGGRWEIHCNAKGALLLEAKCEELTNLNQLGDFVPTNLVSQLIPNINYNLPIEDIPLLAVQLTRFNCGGFTLGVALCRAATDGTATMCFMNAWAKLARGENLDPSEFPCHDRTMLNSRKLTHSSSLHRHHHEFDTPPIQVDHDLGNTREVSVAIVKLTREQVSILKKNVNSRVNFQPTSKDVPKTKPYSTFEVIAGYLWRCVSKARCMENNDQPTRLSTLVNCRNRLKPPLPSGYAGNAAFPTVTPIRSFNDLTCKPLGDAVEDVHKALERVTEEYVMSALDYIDREKDMDLLRYNFHYPAKSVCKGQYKGNPNIFVVSWMNFSYKDADFGLGEPVYFGPGYMDSEGKAFVMNNNGGDIVVAISLEVSCMDNFRKIFYDDIKEVFCTSKL